MCHGHDPLFSGQSALPRIPIYWHCAALVPPFSNFRKISIFSLVLVKISALKTQIFQIFVPKTPHFSRKIRSLDPTFGNLCGTHPPKKKLSAPPGMHLCMYGTVTVVFKAFATIFVIILHYCCMYSIIKFTSWWNIKKTWFLCSLSMCFNTLSMCFINLTDLFFFTFFFSIFKKIFSFPSLFFSFDSWKKILRSPLIPLKKISRPPLFPEK